MAKACGYCSIGLKFSNTPLFGGGRLATGETLCRACRLKLKNVSPALKLRKLTLDDATERLEQMAVKRAVVNVAGQLEKLAGLKEKGLLTQEEFDAQKKKMYRQCFLP